MPNITLSVKELKETVVQLPANISVMIRGDHGIGKSDIVRQCAEMLGFSPDDVIDQRLSQKTEGDVIGLPFQNDGKTTKFLPLDWMLSACESPKLLFLDELNRATMEVMQSAFELALDRRLNGNKLHHETRVFVAVNADARYTINEIDPALLDRFWVVDLEPTVDDWITWGRSKDPVHGGDILDDIIQFIQLNPKMLDPEKNVEADKKTVSRRSWKRLNDALKSSKLMLEPENPCFLPLCLGFVGTEAAISFQKFMSKRDNRLSGEEIVNAKDYDKIRKKMQKLGQMQHNICIERVSHYVFHVFNEKQLDTKQLGNIHSFFSDLPGELRVSFWAKLMQEAGKKIEIATQLQKECSELVIAVHK